MSGDRLAQIGRQVRFVHGRSPDGNGLVLPNRDVLALVEIAKAARDITESIAEAEGFRYVGSEDDIDMLDALASALARLDSGATE